MVSVHQLPPCVPFSVSIFRGAIGFVRRVRIERLSVGWYILPVHNGIHCHTIVAIVHSITVWERLASSGMLSVRDSLVAIIRRGGRETQSVVQKSLSRNYRRGVLRKQGNGESYSTLRFIYCRLVGVQLISVSLAVMPLILLSFSTELSMSSSWLNPLNDATTSNSPGTR